MDLKEAINLSPEEQESMRKLFSYRSKPLSKDVMGAFQPKKVAPPNPMPFVRINDLNNQNERDDWDDNPSKRALEFGLKWTF